MARVLTNPGGGGPGSSRVEECIQRSIGRPTPESRSGTLTLPRELQGWPHIAHGGGVLASLYELARPFLPDRDPVLASVKLQRSVDLERPLSWSLAPWERGLSLNLFQEERLLAEARVETLPAEESLPAALLLKPGGGSEAPTVPGNTGCLACGSENPIGLQIRFHYDERAVWKAYQPRPPYRGADGSLIPHFHFIVLDEIGWWLGVLSAGECGLTNEITVRVLRPTAFGAPLLIHGTRASVVPEDDRGRLWRAEAIVSADGQPVAVGSVRFAGTRGFTKRLIPGFLAASQPEDVRRLFPQYLETARLMEDES